MTMNDGKDITEVETLFRSCDREKRKESGGERVGGGRGRGERELTNCTLL